MKKSKSQSKRKTYIPDGQLINEVQSVLRGRIFHGDVPQDLHGLEEQKRLVQGILANSHALDVTLTDQFLTPG